MALLHPEGLQQETSSIARDPGGAALQAARKSTAEVQAVRATDEEAQRGLQRCQKAEGRARFREESASAEAQRRKEEAGSLSEDLRSCRGALKAAEQRAGRCREECGLQSKGDCHMDQQPWFGTVSLTETIHVTS